MTAAPQDRQEPQASPSFAEDPDHEMLRDAVAAFFREHLPEEKIRAYDQARTIPRDIWAAAADQGWFGLTVPVEYGGAGADVAFGAVLIEEIARRFPSMATIMVVSMMAARALRENGTAQQRDMLLP